MKALIKFSIRTHQEEIDLTEWGHDEEVKWTDISYEEQLTILDSIREQHILYVSGENIED